MKVALIVAAAENGVIGRGGRLPWRIPSDLKTFRRLTLGKPIIMGRKTFESIGKPLDDRDNIVVTRNRDFHAEGVIVADSPEQALERAVALARQRGVDEVVVIGGAELFCALMPVADRIYLTRVHAQPEGDVQFAPPPTAEWREASRRTLPKAAQDDHACTLIVLERCSRP